MTLVLFDVDGTLVNAAGAGRWALEKAFEEVLAVADVRPLAAQVRFNGRTDPMIIADIARLAGIPAESLAARRADLEEAYLARLGERLASRDDARALPGVRALLESLRDEGVPAGLLTGNVERGARLKLAAVGLEGFFETGAYGSDHPDRAFLGGLARERFEARLRRPISPGEVVVIGDAVEDVRAAKANRYRSLAVGTGWTEPGLLAAEGPDLYLDDLSGLPALLSWLDGRS